MNTIQLIGRLTRDPETRFTAGGTPTTSFRLAVSRRKRDGEDQGAVFVDVITYGTLAEVVAEYLTKGRQVAVAGRLEYREWEADDGSKRSKHEVIAAQVDFLAQVKDSNGAAANEVHVPVGADEEPF